MTDQELIKRLEDGTLSHEGFHHREHVRAAFLFLTKYPTLEALQAFSKALRRLAENRGKPQAYHETITWAYVLLIQERMKRAAKNQEWAEFAESNPDLLAWTDGILTRYYRPETLASDLARTIFVFPDRDPA
jgi:hypothetical protein